MKIAIILNEPIFGGTGKHVVQLADGLVKRGNSVAVLFPESNLPLMNALSLDGVEAFPLPMNKYFSLRSYSRGKRILRNFQPDAVHIHGNEAGFWGHVVAGSLNLHPVIYTPHIIFIRHALKRRLNGLLWRYYSRYNDKVIAVSSSSFKSLQIGERGVKVRNDRIVEVLNEIVPEELENKARANHDISLPDNHIVGQVGRFVRQKGPFDFIDMAAKVASVRRDVYFVMVGDGPLIGEAKLKTRELGIADRMIFAGHMDNPYPIVKKFTIATILSYWEGLPYVLLEYLYFGLPVVGNRIPGIAEVLEDIDDLSLVDTGDIEGAADKVLALLEEENRAKAAAKSKEICEAYSSDRMVPAVLEVYRETAKHRT